MCSSDLELKDDGNFLIVCPAVEKTRSVGADVEGTSHFRIINIFSLNRRRYRRLGSKILHLCLKNYRLFSGIMAKDVIP